MIKFLIRRGDLVKGTLVFPLTMTLHEFQARMERDGYTAEIISVER